MRLTASPTIGLPAPVVDWLPTAWRHDGSVRVAMGERIRSNNFAFYRERKKQPRPLHAEPNNVAYFSNANSPSS